MYVDDIIVAWNNQIAMNALKFSPIEQFKLKDLGPLNYFSGLEVARTTTGIFVCQMEYALELISNKEFLVYKRKPTSIPTDAKSVSRRKRTRCAVAVPHLSRGDAPSRRHSEGVKGVRLT